MSKARAGDCAVAGTAFHAGYAPRHAAAPRGRACIPQRVSVGMGPHGLAVTPDGRQVWVPCGGAASLAVIDTRTNGVSQTFIAGLMPHAVAFAPEGRTVYMTNAGQQTLVSLERASGAVRARVPIGTGAAMVALRPDGGRVYVTGQSGSVLTLVCWR